MSAGGGVTGAGGAAADGTDAAAVVVDARGRRCPLPVIELARAVAAAPPGAAVTVLADDPAARTDVPAWCRLRGAEYLGEHAAAGGGTGYTVRRGG